MIKQGWRFCRLVATQFFQGGCMHRAAALSYTFLLALVPLFVVGFSILSAFPMFKGVGKEIQNFVFKNFVADSAHVIQQHLESFVSQASQLPVTSLIFLVMTAVLMVFTMEQAFNDIWHVKKHRKGVSGFLLYWAVITLTPILIGVGLALTSYLMSLPLIVSATELLQIKKHLFIYTPYVLTFAAFTLLYAAVPNCTVRLRHAMGGALIATTLFELAKFGFGLYITNVPTYRLLYGALATVPIFLIWIYVSWLIILFGVVISHVSSQGLKHTS